MSPFLAWGDFHARSRFALSTIPEDKWRLLVAYPYQEALGLLKLSVNRELTVSCSYIIMNWL